MCPMEHIEGRSSYGTNCDTHAELRKWEIQTSQAIVSVGLTNLVGQSMIIIRPF